MEKNLVYHCVRSDRKNIFEKSNIVSVELDMWQFKDPDSFYRQMIVKTKTEFDELEKRDEFISTAYDRTLKKEGELFDRLRYFFLKISEKCKVVFILNDFHEVTFTFQNNLKSFLVRLRELVTTQPCS